MMPAPAAFLLFTNGGLSPLMGLHGSAYFVETFPSGFYGSYGDSNAAVCVKDMATKSLVCRLAGFTVLAPPAEIGISESSRRTLVMSVLWEGYGGYAILEGYGRGWYLDRGAVITPLWLVSHHA
ncbi:hypothetical protein MFIFM68171_04377 [Madurella fahalii]|uniref:Uncharacterized protein n=1 Tax=Madurella fahalii TaxID=1157608 RepID=A0ABQ0G8R8_9PEZI